ncbi:MAG TPA: hypothetical protein VH280_13240 [Verrucomicrobiae bacterium]|nr:hypothetical protein [Verrucomicrobiae bacterium]
MTNVAGTIQFYLGEAADDVTVIFDNGAVTNDLGASLAGANSFALGVHTNYAIVVKKIGSGVVSQISVDATNNSFLGPRGIAVNRNPGSSYFGRIYVANANPGTGPAPGQASGRGIYVLNADTSDCLGFGSAAQTPPGMTPGGSTTYGLFKCFVGTDNTLYVGNADTITFSVNPPGNAAVWAVDPNLTTALPLVQTNAILGTGVSMVSTPFATGSLAQGNLVIYCNLWGFSTNGSYVDLFNFNIDGGPVPYLQLPATNTDFGGLANNNVNGVAGDTYIAPDGKFFLSQDRGSAIGAGDVSLWVYAPDGQTYLWDSMSANGGVDPFSGTWGHAVSPDDKYVVCVNGNGNFEWAALTNGIPDISTVRTNATGLGGTSRAIAFDAADNVYVAGAGISRVRVYSLGLTATCITYNDMTGTNGTFSLAPLATAINVTTTNSVISQSTTYGNNTNSSFTITRTGDLTGNLTIPISLSGTALGGSGYPASITAGSTGASVVLVPGEASTNIVIKAVADSIARPSTTLTITIGPGSGYNLGGNTTVSINVINTSPDELLAFAGAPSMYKAFSNDYASITITRWGDTNINAGTITFNSSSLNFAGTAVEGTDFTPPTPSSVTFNPGDLTQTMTISPLVNGQLPIDTNNAPYTGNKTIIASTASGSGFSGSANTAVLALIDNATPPATYLYLDPLTNVDDSTNSVVTSVNDNMQTNAIDEFVDYGYDLFGNPRDPAVQGSGIQVPMPFPPNGAPTALRMTVNKSSANGQGAAAAVNLYLTNAFFSGNFAIRFNMNLVEGFNGNYTTEGALFGFNHTGQATNWWSGSAIRSGWGANNNETWESDGIWCWISTDDGVGGFANGPSDYVVLTGAGGALPNTGFLLPPLAATSKASMANTLKSTVFTVPQGPGLVANNSPDNTDPSQASSWADVELKQFNNVVTISIDKTPIGVFTNTTSFTNGYVMLGYQDPYDSVGGGDAAVYYSNLRAVRLTPPLISQLALNTQTSTYVFDFTSTDGDATTATFQVVGATSINGPYAVVTGATITQLGNGAFQASVPTSGAIHFYRIQQKM